MFECICFNPHEMKERKKRKRRKGVLPFHGSLAIFHFFLLSLVVIAIISLQMAQKKSILKLKSVHWSKSLSISACQTRPVFYIFNCNHTCSIRLWDSRVNLRTQLIRSTHPVLKSGKSFAWMEVCFLRVLPAHFPSIASGVCVWSLVRTRCRAFTYFILLYVLFFTIAIRSVAI